MVKQTAANVAHMVMHPSQSHASVSPRNSTTPLLQPQQQQPQQPQLEETQSPHAAEDGTEGATATDKTDGKTGKRRLFGLGKKKQDTKPPKPKSMEAQAPPVQAAANSAPRPPPEARARPVPISPSPSRHPYPSAVAASSPSRLRSTSPRLHSPASSEIFERNVQEPVPISTLQGELSPAHIPSHVMTEDHIPPALGASAQAITSDELDPDEVEIVTSTSHLPAAASVLEGSNSHADLTQLQSPILQPPQSDASEVASSLQQSGVLSAGGADDDTASTYGQLDPNDVRRLSFISFADVVQSEQQQQQQQQPGTSQFGDIGSRDSLYIASLPSSVPSAHERTASPLRSPRSPRSPGSPHSQGVTTPPPGVNISPIGEQSPARSASGLAIGQHGELQIETMRQAVRKTASGDLSGVRSAGMSPISDEASFRDARS